MRQERDMGRRLAPVPVRTETTGEDRADRAAFFTVMSLPALAFADWFVMATVIRDVQCERSGAMDCGGSPAMEEAFTTGMLLTVPALAVQMWLIGFAIRRLRDGPRLPVGWDRSRRGGRRRG
ncbi:hypothetical protein [Streptosporangium sandarakinum]|uniref:hypothetical protein n=1 Tax=Streptosporangium sandarakinum TaxID=1260955 RepID=UPI0033A777BA